MVELIHGGDLYTVVEKNEGKKILDFSSNINPFGMPESVKEAAVRAVKRCDCYPDPLCRKLRKATADYHGVQENTLIFGNGAADLIFRLTAAARPKRALLLAPTFAEYESALHLAGCRVEYFFLKEKQGFQLTEEVLQCLDSGLDMVFLCNPNNPTGQMIEHELLLRILYRCRALKIRLVVDECFIDFVEESDQVTLLPFIREEPLLFLLRAFTKNYAMPGLRLGYGICSDRKLMDELYRAGQPWNVSLIAQEAGIAALREREFLHRSMAFIRSEKYWLAGQLAGLGYRVFPPAANYIFFKVENTPDCFQKALLKQGILIRSCDNYKGLEYGYFRTAVRTREENSQLVAALVRLQETDRQEEMTVEKE